MSGGRYVSGAVLSPLALAPLALMTGHAAYLAPLAVVMPLAIAARGRVVGSYRFALVDLDAGLVLLEAEVRVHRLSDDQAGDWIEALAPWPGRSLDGMVAR